MGGPDVNVNCPVPGQQILENNPMQSRKQSRNGRIGPIYAFVDLGLRFDDVPCQIRYII
ncbi:hypothetical protein ABID62_005960 [Bradyrhizobium sp. S3.9.1]|jgi:hypothetical protein